MLISQLFTSNQSRMDTFLSLYSLNDLLDQLKLIGREKSTGQLILRMYGAQVQQWSLYFYLGRLIWAADQMHPVRRWYRQLVQHCPTLPIEPVSQPWNSSPHWYVATLARLLRQGKIRQQDGEAIITGHSLEILFDIFQRWSQIRHRSARRIMYRYVNQSPMESSLAAMPVESVWLQSMRDWQAWRQAGLVDYSPNQAPLLWKVEDLRQKLSPMAYQSLASRVDGRRTLRDVAVKSRQDLLLLTQSIIPHVHQGSIRLIAVEDLQASLQAVEKTSRRKDEGSVPMMASTNRPSSVSPQAARPLIIYIDDHPLHGKMMGSILAHLNYRFMHLQNPVQALLQVLEHRPNLIFLDLAMPIINGYELCAQIRRSAIFNHIPIIILSSNDGVVDRIQAKNAGASDFLAKPIRLNAVRTILQRHLDP
ncbi:MAG: response regulator [Leptolyngbyaceae cyanobacterium MO_188.B28]|nr:response regulator [Leptolyngbyaceae cyanobacterium MO_188.B28]